MPKSDKYWKKRMESIEQSSHDKGMDYTTHIDKQFRIAESNIDKKIEYWYNRLAENNEISLNAAKELLRADELEDFHLSVEEYIKKGENIDYDNRWMKQLENASAKVHISRLEAMKIQMQQECEVLYGNMTDGLDATMRDIYTNGYYHTAYEIQKGTNVGWAFNKLDNRRIENALNTCWTNDGNTFKARCWTNKQKLVNELNTVLTQNIIRGESPQKAIDALSKRMKVSRFNAGRLIMTESAFISSKGQKDCFNELDVEQFQFVATLDSSTSDICRSMDGKVFKMSEYEIGVNAPPLHCFCRSCTVPYFEDNVGERAARGEDGKTYYVPSDMKYADWEKAFVKNKGTNDLTPVTQKVGDISSFISNVGDYYTNNKNCNMEELGRDILDEMGLNNVPVNVKCMKEYGYCTIDPSSGKMKIMDYNLNANDTRSREYQIKTAFHESYHAKADNLSTDLNGANDKMWTKIEETFAESSSHYLASTIGITDLTPSYPEKLVDILPRLKQMPRYSKCNNIADFGKIAFEDRMNGVPSVWTNIYNDCMSVKHDWKDYSKQYFKYIQGKESECIDKMLENMPKYNKYKSSMINDLNDAMDHINNNDFSSMSSNEDMVMSNILAIVMNRNGVK